MTFHSVDFFDSRDTVPNLKFIFKYVCWPSLSTLNLYVPSATLDLFPPPPYANLMSSAKKKGKAVMLGVGLDSDGHKRITTGENFALVGGTEETHEAMTEKVIKINEKLKSRGKQLENVTGKELDDIAQEVGLKKLEPQKRSDH